MGTSLEEVNTMSEDELKTFCKKASDKDLESMFGEHASSVRLYAEVEGNAATKGDSMVILLPGLFGTVMEDNGSVIWVNPLAFVKGKLNNLDLDESGTKDATPGVKISAPRPLWLAYAKIIMRLQHDYETYVFPFDWRLWTMDVAPRLQQFIDEKLRTGSHDKVTLVGHSLGGLLMMDYLIGEKTKAHAESKVKRAIALGAPYKGALEALSALADRPNAQMEIARKLNKNNDPARMVRSFPSMYQILPAPNGLYPDWNPVPDVNIWDPATWAAEGHTINLKHLKAAEAHHRMLAAADPQVPLFNVLGTHYATPVSLVGKVLNALPKVVKEGLGGGDGTVEIPSGMFKDRPTYFVNEEHMELVLERTVIEGIMEWLEGGKPGELVQDISKVVLNDTKLRAASIEGTMNVDTLVEKVNAGDQLNFTEAKTLCSMM